MYSASSGVMIMTTLGCSAEFLRCDSNSAICLAREVSFIECTDMMFLLLLGCLAAPGKGTAHAFCDRGGRPVGGRDETMPPAPARRWHATRLARRATAGPDHPDAGVAGV